MKYFKNTSILLIEKMFRLTILALVTIWIAKYLGPEDFGIYSYILSIVSIFLAFTTLGFDSILIKFFVLYKNKKQTILFTSFYLRLLFSSFLITVLLVLFFLVEQENSIFYYIVIASFATIFQSFWVLDFFFQSQILGRYVALANITTVLVSSAIKIIFIFLHKPLIYFIYMYIFDFGLLSFLLAYFYFIVYKKIDFKLLNKRIGVILLNRSWPLILSSISVILYMKMDQIMIQNMLGSYELGIYSAAIKIIEIWYFIPIIVSSSIFPMILNFKKISFEQYCIKLGKIFSLLFYISLIIILITIVLSPYIIDILFGVQFEQSAQVLIFYSWTCIFVFIGTAGNLWYITENLQLLSLFRSIIGLMINIILNLVLIPKYNLYGAAISTLISQIMVTYVLDFFSKKTRQLFFLKTKCLTFNIIRI
ncbi:MAG: flippase [Campylobacteraceae bacterium]|nr:flippase [Campylobacteraceae bacterium]